LIFTAIHMGRLAAKKVVALFAFYRLNAHLKPTWSLEIINLPISGNFYPRRFKIGDYIMFPIRLSDDIALFNVA